MGNEMKMRTERSRIEDGKMLWYGMVLYGMIW